MLYFKLWMLTLCGLMLMMFGAMDGLAAGAVQGDAPVAPVAPHPPGTILIEDNDPEAVETTFEAQSRDSVMYFAAAKERGNGQREVIVSPTIPVDGWYQVWMRWTTFPRTIKQHATKVPVSITHRDGVEDFTINQQSGNEWVMLGTHRFSAGKRPLIRMSNAGTEGSANWDAIRLVPLDARPVPQPAPELPSDDNDFSRLRRNIVDLKIARTFGRGNDETDPDAIALAAANEREARMLWDSMRSDSLDESIWLATRLKGSWSLTRETGNLNKMATAYLGASNHLGLDLRGNPQLLADILRGLDSFATRYHTTTKWDVNWWDFEIGVPLNLLATLVALRDEVPREQRDMFVAAVTRFTEDPRKFYKNGPASTGANRLWLCRVAMLRGAVAEDAALLAIVQEAVLEPLRFVQRDPATDASDMSATDGFYPDGSFLQHKGLPYVAAYGYLLMESFADVAQGLKQTPWALQGPEVDNAFRIIEACFDPFVVRGETVANVVGRSLGSPNYEGNQNAANFLITATKLLPIADEAQAARVQALIKKWIVEEPSGELLRVALRDADAASPLSAAALNRIASDDAIQPLPARQGFEMFANMDIATHRGTGFTAALGMNSTRIKTYESIWGANITGWYQSEGLLLLYTPDVERYRDRYFKLVDPYRFPGTTVERLERDASKTGGANPGKYGGGEFVGGVALDGQGVAAMHLKPQVGNLEARKAWFFFGDQIICLGAGIGADSEHRVETTLANARLIGPEQQLLINGETADPSVQVNPEARWAHLNGTRPGADLGWVLLGDNPPLHALTETRAGSTHLDNPLIGSMRFATLWLDHGNDRANNGRYAYAILPGASKSQVAAYAQDPTVKVLLNTPAVQVVADKAAGYRGIVAWAPGNYADVEVSQPTMILIRETAEGLALAVSDPTMKLDQPLNLTLPLAMRELRNASEGIAVQSLDPLTLEIDLAGTLGQSLRADFLK